MKPETFSELGKACLNIAVGLFLVGIAQPYLSAITGKESYESLKKIAPSIWEYALPGFLLFGILGVILLNTGGKKDDSK